MSQQLQLFGMFGLVKETETVKIGLPNGEVIERECKHEGSFEHDGKKVEVYVSTTAKKTLDPVYMTVTPSKKTAPAKPIKIAPPRKVRKSSRKRDWQCNECGRLLTLKQAEKAILGNNLDGCPGCGSTDIDLAR